MVSEPIEFFGPKSMADEEQQPLIELQKKLQEKKHTRKLRRLKYSCEEVYERMDNGLCLFCDELDTPGHHDLKHKGIQIFMVDDDLASQTQETVTEPIVEIEKNLDSFIEPLVHESVSQIIDSVPDVLIVHTVDSQDKEVEESSQQSTNGNDKTVAHQLFDQMPLRKASKEKQRKYLKAWKFKFKPSSKRSKSMAGEFSFVEATVLLNEDPQEIIWGCVNKEFKENVAGCGKKAIERLKLDDENSRPAVYDGPIQIRVWESGGSPLERVDEESSGDVKFHLKHKWRSRVLQRLSGLEFCLLPAKLDLRWPKGESKPHKRKSHQIETFEVLSSLEPSRRCRNDSLDVVDECMCNELVCEEDGDSIITMSAKFGKTYEDPRFELVCLKQSHDPVEVNLDNFESALTISSLRHTPTYQYRAPFNPYQNCNDQCDRESEEIEDDELQGSLVVINDLSYNHGCVIGKTIGSICDSELGQDNSLDEEEFKGLKLEKLSKNGRRLSIVCLLGIMGMSCWTQLSSLLKANEMSLRERDRWKWSEKQRTYNKAWKFKYIPRFMLSVLLQNEQHKLLQGRNIKCKMKKMEVLRRIKQSIFIEMQFHMKNNSEFNFQTNTKDAELETTLIDRDTFQKPLEDFYRACAYDYMALRVLELIKDKASRKTKLYKNWWFKYKLNTWLSGALHHTGFVKNIQTFSPMINDTHWDKESWTKLNPESCKGGSLLEFLKRHEARFDMIKVPNNTKFFKYLKLLVLSYILRIEDDLKGCKFVKFTMEQSEKPWITILSYEMFHSPRPPELSCGKEDEQSFVLNLIEEQTRDWSFFGLLLQWKWHPPPQSTSEFHQAHNDKPSSHQSFIFEDKDDLKEGVL